MTLLNKKCIPCEGGTKPLGEEQISKLKPEVPGWQVSQDLKKISREWQFKDFVEAVIFVNDVAHLAEDEGHHPDIKIHSYKKVLIELYTHAIGGLSENDFILAAKINEVEKNLVKS